MNQKDENSPRRNLYSISNKRIKVNGKDNYHKPNSKVLYKRSKKILRNRTDEQEIHNRGQNEIRQPKLTKNKNNNFISERTNLNLHKHKSKINNPNNNSIYNHNNEKRRDRIRNRKSKFISRKSKHKKTVHKRIFLLLILTIAIITLIISTIFTSTAVKVESARLPFAISGTFKAVRSPLVGEDISYTLKGPVVIDVDKTIEAKKQTRQITKAQGKVILHNTHPKGEPLDLINRTRLVFENEINELDPSGKGDCKVIRCWRLKGPETIPGGKQKGGEFVPGTKEVTVVADKSGKNYNVEKINTRFIIPGLKNYKSFSDSYAESSSVIVGGFEGIKYVAEDDVYLDAEKYLKTEIQNILTKDLYESIKKLKSHPEIVFEDGLFIEYQKIKEKQGDEQITLSQKGILRAVAFKEIHIAELIYSSIERPYEERFPVNVEDMDLEFQIIDKDFIDKDVDNGEFEFTLSGNGVLTWDIDELTLFRDIKGKNKEEAQNIIKTQYPWIKNHEIIIFPVWNKKVSSNRNAFKLEK